MKKRTIAIVAGGDSSEIVVSLRSAQGIYSFIDKERYNLYIVEMEGKRWEVILPNGEKTPIDRNDFSFMENGEKKNFDFAYITIHGTPGENGLLQGYFGLMKQGKPTLLITSSSRISKPLRRIIDSDTRMPKPFRYWLQVNLLNVMADTNTLQLEYGMPIKSK